MPYRFTLTTVIPASPGEIYAAWLDSESHSEMTGGRAAMSDQEGAEISAWDGYIRGRNLQLVPGERIVQSWRSSEFTDEHEDSLISVILTPAGAGTLVTLEHSNVPDDQRSYEEDGWQANYFEPMVAYFTARNLQAAGTPRIRAAKALSPKGAPTRAAKTDRKVKRTTNKKSKLLKQGAKGSGTEKPVRTKRGSNKIRGGVAAAARKRSGRSKGGTRR